MMTLIVRVLANTAALYVAQRFVSGFVVIGGWERYLLAGVLLGLLNLIVKPILKFISFPLIILTLGLFTLVINAFILWTVDYAFDFITIHSLVALGWGTLIVTGFNLLATKSE